MGKHQLPQNINVGPPGTSILAQVCRCAVVTARRLLANPFSKSAVSCCLRPCTASWLRAWWGDDEPGPASEKAESADRCDGAEPANIRQRQSVKTAAEENKTREDQEVSGAISRGVQGDNDESERMQKVIQN